MITVWESVHQDDLKKFGAAVRSDCMVCKSLGLEFCHHEISVSTINHKQAEARAINSIQENIRRDAKHASKIGRDKES